MKKSIVNLLMIFSLLISPAAFAQDAGAGGGGDSLLDDTFKDMSIVIGCMAGGAILGLSTLSFVEEPKDNLQNIVVGGAIGIIIGVGIVAWQQASKGSQIYEETTMLKFTTPNFNTSQRLSWHQKNHRSKNSRDQSMFGYQFTF